MSLLRYIAVAFVLANVLILFVLFFEDRSTKNHPLPAANTFVFSEQKKPEIVYGEGKPLFEKHCHSCHSFRNDPNVLSNVETRGPWTDRKNLIAWIKSPKDVTPQYEYTRQLIAQFNGNLMPAFPQLTNGQIEDILNYIQLMTTSAPN